MNLIQSLRQNERWTTVASHVFLFFMMLFLGIGCIRFVKYIDVRWNSTGMVFVCILISLEAILSYRIVEPLSNRVIYRGSEWIVILITVKVFTEIRSGVNYFLQNFSQWSRDFVLNFLSPELVLNLGLVIFIWVTTTLFARSLKSLEGDELMVADTGLPVDRRAAHGEILDRYLMLGLVLVIFAGIMRGNPFGLFNRPLASVGDISFVFIYFLLGLVLLSLTNFASLRASWISEKATIRQNLAPPWILYSLIFLTGLTILAMLLPTRYTLGLLDILAYFLRFLEYIYQIIAAALFFILASLIHIISLIFVPSKPAPSTPNPGLNLDNLLQQAPGHLTMPSWWDFAKSVFFWIVFAAILFYAFSQYLQRNRKLAEVLAHLSVTRWLILFWSWLQNTFRRARKNVQNAIQTGIRQLGTRQGERGQNPTWNLVNLRRLTPRQRVLFFYHALIRRAGESGLSRPSWMTPNEYALILGKELSEQGEDVTLMTGAFLEARYTRHEVREDLAARVKSTWDRIRSYLRTWHKE